jgi:LytS/YehU family sensor histidine kinase
VFILVFAISTCITVIQQWLKTESNRKEIEREKLNTELLFLKSQVNPHFFFNTLNNIYSLALTKSEKTASTILQLSSVMRYVISDAQANFVTLEEELEFLRNFIDIQLVRLTDKVKVDFTVNGSLDGKRIAPLLFIPFVENAFKYGVSTKENTSIIFHFTVTENKIIFSSSNSIIDTSSKETTGIGIANVKRRLALLYPDKHNLQIFNTGNTYSTQLEIQIK